LSGRTPAALGLDTTRIFARVFQLIRIDIPGLPGTFREFEFWIYGMTARIHAAFPFRRMVEDAGPADGIPKMRSHAAGSRL
jgi:hypothetical protein